MTNEFMYAKGQDLFIGQEKILLQGVGLGGWMLPEGYMWGSYGKITRPRKFEERIIELIGKEESLRFWNTYYQNFISDEDFALIKSNGFNSVRLPFNFRMLMEENESTDEVVFLEQGFKMIDYTIKECKKNNLYLILDLHGAPGGQTGTNIDDSKYDKPELFQKRIYQVQTVKLWKEIARRYKHETQVIMYDLLNEPLPDWNKALYKHLYPFYKELIQEIRSIDKNHLISLEGAHWATDFSMFTERLDDNVVLHFHKYWNSPELEKMEEFLEKRKELDYPLFMGEGGENDLYWYSASFKMYEQLNIGWNFWAYKKIQNTNSIISFKKDEGWKALFEDIVDIDKETALTLLNSFLENIKFENCVVNQDVVNHLFRKDSVLQISTFYDYYGKGISFDNENKEEGFLRKNDCIKVVNADGGNWEYNFSRYSTEKIEKEMYPYIHLQQGEWYTYTFHVTNENRKVLEITFKDLEFDVFLDENPRIGKYAEGLFQTSFVPQKKTFVVKVKANSQGILKQIRLI